MSWFIRPSSTTMAARAGFTFRLACLVGLIFFLGWLANRQLGIGSRYVIRVSNFRQPDPAFTIVVPDSLLTYWDETGRERYRLGRGAFRFSLRPPRSFATVRLSMKIQAADVSAAALAPPLRPGSRTRTAVFWNMDLPSEGWTRLQSAGLRVYQRADAEQLPNITTFLEHAATLNGVASLSLNPPVGLALDPTKPLDLTNVQYLILPAPQRDGPSEEAFTATFSLADLIPRDGVYTFTLLAAGLGVDHPSFELVEFSAEFEGEALLPAKLWRQLRRPP